jgi:hypothetical protein
MKLPLQTKTFCFFILPFTGNSYFKTSFRDLAKENQNLLVKCCFRLPLLIELTFSIFENEIKVIRVYHIFSDLIKNIANLKSSK